MATVTFYANNYVINDAAGSGLGFYGDAGFAASVSVGSYQGRTFITNGAGTTQGEEANNVKFLNAGSGILGQSGSGVALTAIPNSQGTLNIRFTNATAVKVQSATLYGYDRSNIYNSPSGVVLKAAELIHPTSTQVNNGSGDTTWTTLAGSGSTLSLCPSPGPSGLYAGNGSNSQWSATQHDWYVALSVSPDSIGSKTAFGLAMELEYL
jgi:hypothetical protein